MGELVIDSFAGGGGASTGIAWALGRDPDIAINHDAEALAMHAANHPGTRHLPHNVWKVDPVEICGGRSVGLLWASPDCFPAGTLVLTEEGYRPIEEIRVGDRVLTHEQRWRRVTETSGAFRPLITLRGHGHPGLTMSPEHPIFARQRRDTWRTQPRGYERGLNPADWMPASALGQGWYWATPTRFPLDRDVPAVGGRGMPFDLRLMWLVGRYLGDGWTRLTADRAELVITCGLHEVDGLREKLSVWERQGNRATSGELAWNERETSTAYQFTTNHRGLVEWLREHFGHRAENKRLPAWALGLTSMMREALLAGYLSADGWRHDHFYEARTVSKALAFSIKSLVTSLGATATVHRLKNSSLIEGRTVITRPIYLLRWRHALDPKHAQTFREGDGYEWAPIREQIDVEESAEVFNIGVEQDESYVVEGIIVHNCKHHSKAKGGKPRSRAIRDLAWVVVKWARQVRPRVILLENVEEFRHWGPIDAAGIPCPDRKGATFDAWVAELKRLGYRVQWRELRACDYGAPTIRRRLFLVARRDGLPIVWPAPTHGAPTSPGVLAGTLKPWRTAAEIIDWSLPCQSIFLTREQGRAVGVNRPLAEATMARIAKGVKRYVLDATSPFIVPLTHQGAARGHALDEPVRTVTGAHRGEQALVTPFVAGLAHGESGGRRTYDMAEPLTTVHAGGNNQALVAPFVAYAQQGGAVRDVDGPMHTVTASAKDCNTVVAPLITKFHAGSAGASIEDPLATVTSNGFVVRPGGAAPLGLVAACCVKNNHGDKPMYGLDEPAHTVVAGGTHHFAVAAHLSRQFGASVGSDADDPVGTVTAGGGGKTALVSAFLAQHNGDRAPKPGRSAEDPISTLTVSGSHQAVVEASLLSHSYGSNTAAGAGDPAEPLKTVTSGGLHASEVRAFLVKYYGEGSVDQPAGDPLHTVPTHDRFGLVTTTIDGQPYAIIDIGMRMLSPRELFRAQGFPDSYVIDRGIDADGAEVRLTKTAQVRMCGNSVCPPMAEALVRANYSADQVARPKPVRSTTLPLFDGVAA